ncbi:MAG TPA: MraY family glycosyltransferase [Candidatus Babeliaceae bacterium]|nr:MraY family glycosyltransferase [Candidatus Babeliaceae bacterium]
MVWIWLCGAFCSALAVSLILLPIIISIAYRWNILDYPNGFLKCHKRATPYLGGVGLAIASAPGFLGFGEAGILGGWMFFGLCFLLTVGLLDDLWSLGPCQKIAGQFIGTLLLVKAGLYLKYPLPFLPSYLNIPCSILWGLSIINAFNFVDVMDGLAVVIAIASSLVFLLFALISNMFGVAFFLSFFLGGLAGFLIFNQPPAKIYLGDAGSLFIGGVLSMMLFIFPWGACDPLNIIIPAMVLCVPLIELITLIVIRIYKEIPFYRGSPDHFCHYLQRKGWDKTFILIITFCYALAVGLSSILCFLYPVSIWFAIGLFVAFIIGWLIFLFTDAFA